MTDQKRAEEAAREWVNTNHPTKDCNMRMAFISGVRWRDEQEDSDMTTAYLVGHAKAKDESARRIAELEAELDSQSDFIWSNADIKRLCGPMVKERDELKGDLTACRAELADWKDRVKLKCEGIETLTDKLEASQAREERLADGLLKVMDDWHTMNATELYESLESVLADHAKAKAGAGGGER